MRGCSSRSAGLVEDRVENAVDEAVCRLLVIGVSSDPTCSYLHTTEAHTSGSVENSDEDFVQFHELSATLSIPFPLVEQIISQQSSGRVGMQQRPAKFRLRC